MNHTPHAQQAPGRSRAQLLPGHHPDPIDIRLVPAAGLSIIVCCLIPSLGITQAQAIPVVCAGLALICTGLLVRTRHRPTAARTTAVAILALTFWCATATSMSASVQRVATEETGWAETVRREQTQRMELSIQATPTQSRSPSRWGSEEDDDRVWYIAADVERYGRSLTVLDHPSAVTLSTRDEDPWATVQTGDIWCVFATPSVSSSGSVFIRPDTTPAPGRCPATDSSATLFTDLLDTDTGGAVTGRDDVREQLRSLSSTTVGDAPGLLPGLILGDRSAQSTELTDAMRDSGLSHLSAVSGANCALVAGAVTLFLRSLRAPRPVVLAAVLGTLVLFVHLVGWEPSVVRAGVMGGLSAWVLFFGRGRHALPVLCLAILLILTLMPHLAGEPAFQLSVASTSGIILFAQPLHAWLTHAVFGRFLPDAVATMVSAALAVAVVAQLACEPLITAMTDTVNLYAIPANLLAAPLVPFITVPGTLAAFLGVLTPELSALILTVIGLPAAGIAAIAHDVSSWPGALIAWPEGVLGQVLNALHLAGVIAGGYLLLRWQRRPVPPTQVHELTPTPGRNRTGTSQWIRKVRDATTDRGLVACALIVVVAVIAQAAVLLPPVPGTRTGIPDDWLVISCSVGQGDMFMVRSGPSSALIVDTGPEENAARDCIHDSGITHTDLLVLTHMHADHISGTPAVTDVAPAQRTLFSSAHDNAIAEFGPDRLPNDAIRAEPGMYGVIHPQLSGDETTHYPTVHWQVMAADAHASNENNASVVLLVTLVTADHKYRVTVLFTGDMEEDAAASLVASGTLPETVDILKVGHHGARNGGTQIISELTPTLGLIGVGQDNDYGHPADEIIEELAQHGSVVRTDLHGTSALTLDAETGHLNLITSSD